MLLDRGRAFGVGCRFWFCDRGGFFMVDGGGLAIDDILLGVADVLVVAALTLLLPGTVIAPRKLLVSAQPL